MIFIQQQPFVFEYHFNADIIRQNYGDDMNYCREMFLLFLETIPRDYFVLKNAIDTKNLLDIFQISQRIKPSFYWVGLDDCSNSLELLAHYARFNNEDEVIDHGSCLLEKIDQKIIAVRRETERMNNYLKRA